jgi:hypothetical protein
MLQEGGVAWAPSGGSSGGGANSASVSGSGAADVFSGYGLNYTFAEVGAKLEGKLLVVNGPYGASSSSSSQEGEANPYPAGTVASFQTTYYCSKMRLYVLS